MLTRIRDMRRDDSGVAIVAAVGVGIIGVMLATLVVSQVIMVTNDAARDRIRTAEIHSAEGAVDAAMKEMEATLNCEPSFSPIQVGEGASAVTVDLDIRYYTSDGTLMEDCDSEGRIVGLPSQAVIRAVGTPVNEVVGLVPERTIEAQVRITPRQGLSVGTSIFSGDYIQGTNSGRVIPTDDDFPAGLWIDNGNFDCNSSFYVDGDVIVVEGGAYLTNTCEVTGNLWARDYLSVSSGNRNFDRVGKDIIIYDGNMTVSNRNSFGGNISVNGTVGGAHWSGSTVKGTVCADNAAYPDCGPLPFFEARGFPEVYLEVDEWDGFTYRDRAGWGADVKASWTNAPNWWGQSNVNDFCTLGNWISNWDLHLPTSDRLYDLTACDVNLQGTTIHLYSDVAIFANAIQLTNGVRFKSGDGEDHNLWLIVPTGSTGHLNSNNLVIFDPEISSFFYSANELRISNNQTIRGQIYGKKMHVSNNFELNYVPIGIPGVDLGTGLEISQSGFSIDVLSKRETRN